MVETSIIIPVLNQVYKLDLCLNALNLQVQDDETIEVLVVDNGSSDGSELLAQKYNFKQLICLDSNNPYKARNLGATVAKGNNLVFLDAKCTPLENYIREIKRLSKSGNWDIVSGDFDFLNLTSESSLSALAYAVTHLRTNPFFNAGEVATLTGNMIVKKEVFFELGKFVENRSGGDVRFSQLAEKKDKNKIFTPQLKVGYSAKEYSDLIKSLKRDAVDSPHKLSILGVRPAGSRYIEERLKSFNIDLPWYKKNMLQFFIMYLRMLKYFFQYR